MVFYCFQRASTFRIVADFFRFLTFHIVRDMNDGHLADIFRTHARKPFKLQQQSVNRVHGTGQNAFLSCEETAESAENTGTF